MKPQEDSAEENRRSIGPEDQREVVTIADHRDREEEARGNRHPACGHYERRRVAQADEDSGGGRGGDAEERIR